MAKDHNMIEHVKRNYMGKVKPEKIYTVEADEESGEMARVRANITCYNCGKTGHYSSECRTERKVVKRYTPTEGNTNRSYSVETRSGGYQRNGNKGSEPSRSGYESSCSKGSRRSRSSRDSTLQTLRDLKDPVTQVQLSKDQLEEPTAFKQDFRRHRHVDVVAEVHMPKADLIA